MTSLNLDTQTKRQTIAELMAKMQKTEQDNRRKKAEQKAADRRQEAIERFGKDLGLALFNYTEEPNDIPEEQAEKELATAFVLAFKYGDDEKQILAMRTLLSAIKAVVEPVAIMAENAAARGRPVG